SVETERRGAARHERVACEPLREQRVLLRGQACDAALQRRSVEVCGWLWRRIQRLIVHRLERARRALGRLHLDLVRAPKLSAFAAPPRFDTACLAARASATEQQRRRRSERRMTGRKSSHTDSLHLKSSFSDVLRLPTRTCCIRTTQAVGDSPGALRKIQAGR